MSWVQRHLGNLGWEHRGALGGNGSAGEVRISFGAMLFSLVFCDDIPKTSFDLFDQIRSFFCFRKRFRVLGGEEIRSVLVLLSSWFSSTV